MGGDEIVARNAVAVEEDAIIPGRREDGAIADFGKAKAVVGLPDMAQPAVEARRPVFDQVLGRFGGPVIGDQHLEIRIALA